MNTNCYDFLCLPSINAELLLTLPPGATIPSELRGKKVTLDSLSLEVGDLQNQVEVRMNGHRLRYLFPKETPLLLAGSSANVAVGLARLGGKVALSGGTGTDPFGAYLSEGIVTYGITNLCFSRNSPTPLTVSLIDPTDGCATLLCWKPPYQLRLEQVLPQLQAVQADYLVATSIRCAEVELVYKLFVEAKQRKTVLVPSQEVCRLSGTRKIRRILAATGILQVNEEEASLILGKKLHPEEAASRLLRLGPQVAIVTLGNQGSVSAAFSNGNHEVIRQEALPAETCDTTGAGDGFLVGFLWACSQEYDHASSLRIGSWVAARNIEQNGGHGGMPTTKELRRFVHSIVS